MNDITRNSFNNDYFSKKKALFREIFGKNGGNISHCDVLRHQQEHIVKKIILGIVIRISNLT